ncbi:DNA helicase, partial [Tanacetum coccineum]
KIETAEQVDPYILAGLPDPKEDTIGNKIVSDLMMHSPFGRANSNAPCMQKVSKTTGVQDFYVINPKWKWYILYEIEAILNGFRKLLKYFGLPDPPLHLLEDLKNKLLMEEKNYKCELLMQEKIDLVPKLNTDQRRIYDMIIHALANNQQELIFVYGHGGRRKTFLWKTITNTLQSERKIILAVASSRITLLLLPSRRTAHSRFKISLELTDKSFFVI